MSTKQKVAGSIAVFGISAISGVFLAHKMGLFETDSEIMSAADYKFMAHVSKYGKNYASRAEYDLRADIYKENLIKIETHNDQGHKHFMSENRFMDSTKKEFSSMLGFKGTASSGAVYTLDTSSL